MRRCVRLSLRLTHQFAGRPRQHRSLRCGEVAKALDNPIDIPWTIDIILVRLALLISGRRFVCNGIILLSHASLSARRISLLRPKVHVWYARDGLLKVLMCLVTLS